MIAAVYCRKSTAEHGVGDEQKSVARQLEHARLYAARKGWTIDEAHIYVDDGISGAEFSRRPGFMRLMAALKPAAPFGVLIVSEESRIGREQIEVSFAVKQLVQAGVRIFSYLTDTERRLDSPIEKIMLSLQAMTDEMERAKASQRTKDALVMKFRNGHVTGGRVFGYDLVDVVHGERRVRAPGAVRHPEASHVERRIN